MLHNTGPYGPNETPINMGAPVNMTPMSGHMNLAHNINNLNKMGHQSVPTASGHYNLPDYPTYNHSGVGMQSQMGQFPNYSQLGFQNNYMSQNAGGINEMSWQNGMFPLNRSMHSEDNPSNVNYGYDKRMTEQMRQEMYKAPDFRKTPLNIPQLPNKMYNKHFNESSVHNQSDSYQNFQDNLDFSMKSQEKMNIDSNRMRNIENTVKLIENILIQSSNKPKLLENQSEESKNPKSDSPLDKTLEKILRNPKNVPNTSKTVTEKSDTPLDGTLQNVQKHPKNILNTPKMTSKKLKPAPSTTKTVAQATENSNLQEVTKNQEQTIKKPDTETDPLALSPKPSKKGRTTIDKPAKSTEAKNNEIQESQTDDESSDSDDEKPMELTHKAPHNSKAIENAIETVEIKIENTSWVDLECFTPFLKDCNGLHPEDMNMLSCKVIDGENSVKEAVNAYKSGVKLEGLLECPHCSLLFKHPKRFLIHNKWHTFGLTNERRTEIAKLREQKRNERKEAKILEQIKSTEVTDVPVDGKTFSCKDCDKVFTAKASLKNHRQRTHPSKLRECRICHKVITSWTAMRQHVATHSAESGVGYQCVECPKRFKYAHSLAKHADTHLEKTHACSECPKKFGSANLLRMHMKTHERVLRGATFRCTYCGKGFFESYSLQVHERTHRNERPYTCDICNTSYGTNSSLKRHIKVSHNTAKPHQCSVCHRNFSTESIRDRHESRLHGNPEDFKYPCKQCACKYLNLKDLQKHVYKMHPKGKRKKKAPKSDSE